ncbi:MAG: transposase family protein [Prevotellaceae bacterium]|jgi:transcriptional regulator with XRE-family HTH domain|nr:transposase family protein [Prevotellaceae bacterium]
MAKVTKQQAQRKSPARQKKKTLKKAKAATGKKVAPAKHAGGRPTPYRDEYAKMAMQHCLLGATNKDLAALFGVAVSTISKWMKDFQKFSDAIKKGKEEADICVASALFKRATGFVKDDCEKVFNNKGSVVRAKTREYFPPETAAAIFWLKNRQPGKWREKQTQVLENPDGTPLSGGRLGVVFSDMDSDKKE